MEAQINDHKVFYTIEGQGRPMLFMHGGPGLDHTHFRPWLDVLGTKAQLIYYDQFGQGRSSRPQSFEGVGFDTWSDEADGLRQFLGHDKIILFGFSFGGFIAQDYALRYGEHLDGLILCDTAPVVDYPDVMMANAQARSTPEQWQMAAQVLSQPIATDEDMRRNWMTVLPLYFNHYDPAIGDAMDKTTQYSAGASNQGMGVCLPTFNTLNRLSEIHVPTLILTGRYDWITPPLQGAQRLHDGISDSQQVIFEDSGHFPFIEEHDKFVSVVDEWLNKLH
jgi:proline iminopeptidase